MNLYDSASLLVTPNGYKTSKLYSVIPSDGSGDMTFSRAGDTATRVNSSGLIETVLANKPRLDYTSSTCPKLLLEPQRTNLVLRSNEFDNVTWTKINGASITANTVVSPDGTQNADTLNFNGTAFGQIQQALVKTIGETYTFSLYIKSNSATSVDLYIGGSFSSVTVTSNWTRVSVTKTLSTTDASVKIVSSTIKSFDIYGAQMELGAYPTSYISTTSATVTRNADNITRGNIYTNGFITSAGGTWFIDLENNFSLQRDNSGGLGISTLSNPSTGDGFSIRSVTGTKRLIIVKYINSVFTTSYDTLTDKLKIAIKWNGKTADIFVNGIKAISSTPFTATNMQFLNSDTQDVPKNIKLMMLFPTALSDANCVTLTTL